MFFRFGGPNLYLQEKNYEETHLVRKHLLSKGFLPEITIQGFPIRDKRVFLHIKRRRRLNTTTGKVQQRDWNQVGQGTRMTSEFAAFLSDRRSERDSSIRPRMTPILLDVFMGSMVKSYYDSTKNLKVDLGNGIKSTMPNNGCCMLKIWVRICGPPPRSIDETSLSDGELYTIRTNKAAHGRCGSIIAIIAGKKAETVIEILRKISLKTRKKVSEITLDMAGNMAFIAKRCFPSATQVTDRFHVQNRTADAVGFGSLTGNQNQVSLASN